MARKKAEVVATVEQEEVAVSKAKAVRDAIEKVGKTASNDDVRAALLSAHPSLTEWAGTQAFGQYCSNQRNPKKKGSVKPEDGEITIPELMAVKEALAESDTKEMARAIEKVKEVAAKADVSIEKLLRGLEILG